MYRSIDSCIYQLALQVLPAHKGAVTAVAFSPDGKFLASYGINDNKLSFWQVRCFDKTAGTRFIKRRYFAIVTTKAQIIISTSHVVFHKLLNIKVQSYTFPNLSHSTTQ